VPNSPQDASDQPLRSASETLGRHLLGRIYLPDERDWSLDRLMTTLAEPSDAIRDMTVEQVLTETPYFSNWNAYLIFWRWLKNQREPPPGPAPESPAWPLNIQLDQGQTGHCVGFGWSHWVDAAPVVGSYQNADAHALYYECKVLDGEPGAENGSTVRSGALALRERGRLVAFAFARSTGEINDWVNHNGPIVVGTTWTTDMFTPDSNGYVTPSGGFQGGHCYILIDRLADEDAYLFQNSWGSAWGLNGRFKIKVDDFAGLLDDQGEACCSAELSM
jgi:hypothetical protein